MAEQEQSGWSELDVCTLNAWEGYCARKGGCLCEKQDAKQYALIQIGQAARVLAQASGKVK